jgi:hypothetical protein
VADEIVLHFEVAPGFHPDTRIVAQALLKWVVLVEQAAKAIDPSDKIELEIVGNDKGSLRFPQIIKFAERGIENIDAAWADYPHLKRAVLGSAHVFATGIVGGLIQVSMTPEVQKVQIVGSDRPIYEEMERRVAESESVRAANREFYRTIERERSITGVGVAPDRISDPYEIIPRSEFQTRSGLWTIESDVDREHIKTDVWDVVLLKAPFSHKKLRWQFSRDGLPFSALMQDAKFLAAVKDGRVPITLQEGVIMRIEVEYTERLEGQAWKANPKSRRVVRVLEPQPLPAKAPPAPLTDRP